MSDRTQWYRLDPVDAWFFRDARPSNRGEDQSSLESIFPPYATTVVGAVRAALARARGWCGLGQWPDSLKPVIGDGFDDFGLLSFVGPFLMHQNRILFPMPRHIFGWVDEGGEETTFHPCAVLEPSDEEICSDSGHVRLPRPPQSTDGRQEPLKHPEGFLVDSAGMDRILSGAFPKPENCIHARSLFRTEPRTGIERDTQTLTTGKNAMYSPHYVRLTKGVSLVVGIRGLPEEWQVPPLFPLGGESRLATCAPLATQPELPSSPPRDGNAILVLLTPARFDPTCWWGANPGASAAALNHALKGQVVTAAMDRPLRIGGWDSINRRPMPLRPCVAPGAVWWIEGAAIPGSNGTPLMLGENNASGFGLALAANRTNEPKHATQ